MQIFDLPKLKLVDNIYVQYFNNTDRDHVAQHVIKIQYITNNTRARSFIIPMSSDSRNINRKAKTILGQVAGDVIKQKAKQLKKAKINRSFGFRKSVCTWSIGKNTKFYSQKSDSKTQCWLYDNDGVMEIHLTWAGEVIQIQLDKFTHRLTRGQSKAVGYYISPVSKLANRKSNELDDIFSAYDLMGVDQDNTFDDLDLEDQLNVMVDNLKPALMLENPQYIPKLLIIHSEAEHDTLWFYESRL